MTQIFQFVIALCCFAYHISAFSSSRFVPSIRKCVNSLETRCTAFDNDGEEIINKVQLIPSENPIEDLIVKLKGTCVFFVGPMGSGKSTLGDAFAKKMGYRFLDTDEIAEFMIEMPISKFFAEGRESEFRQLEYDILMDLSQYTRVVVATGGGIVMKNENWGMLRHGIVVYIDMPIDDIHTRLISDPAEIVKRPLLQGKTLLVQ